MLKADQSGVPNLNPILIQSILMRISHGRTSALTVSHTSVRTTMTSCSSGCCQLGLGIVEEENVFYRFFANVDCAEEEINALSELRYRC